MNRQPVIPASIIARTVKVNSFFILGFSHQNAAFLANGIQGDHHEADRHVLIRASRKIERERFVKETVHQD
jgi:hypothetical protein